MDVTRRGDWEAALAHYLAQCEGKPYAYGSHDCALFAAGAVMAMTGTDIAAEFRGKYRSQAGSVRALRTIGAGTLEATIDAKLEPVAVGFAQRGDLVLHEGAVGVSAGRFAVFVGDMDEAPKLIRVPRAAWQKAWRVG